MIERPKLEGKCAKEAEAYLNGLLELIDEHDVDAVLLDEFKNIIRRLSKKIKKNKLSLTKENIDRIHSLIDYLDEDELLLDYKEDIKVLCARVRKQRSRRINKEKKSPNDRWATVQVSEAVKRKLIKVGSREEYDTPNETVGFLLDFYSNHASTGSLKKGNGRKRTDIAVKRVKKIDRECMYKGYSAIKKSSNR